MLVKKSQFLGISEGGGNEKKEREENGLQSRLASQFTTAEGRVELELDLQSTDYLLTNLIVSLTLQLQSRYVYHHYCGTPGFLVHP